MFADKISGWKVAGESKEKEGQKWERSGGAQKWWESKSGGGVLSTLIITLLHSITSSINFIMTCKYWTSFTKLKPFILVTFFATRS